MVDFVKLKKICEDLSQKKIEILYVTYYLKDEECQEFTAATNVSKFSAEIILSAKNCKTDEKIIKAVAHELVHILNYSSSHLFDFTEQWDKTERTLIEKLNE